MAHMVPHNVAPAHHGCLREWYRQCGSHYFHSTPPCCDIQMLQQPNMLDDLCIEIARLRSELMVVHANLAELRALLDCQHRLPLTYAISSPPGLGFADPPTTVTQQRAHCRKVANQKLSSDNTPNNNSDVATLGSCGSCGSRLTSSSKVEWVKSTRSA